ncbi:MAG: 30S ribosomal protein S20 [Candidatus Spechtbacterales bacterium]
MPNLEAGKKALRQNKKRSALNRRYKNRVKDLVKEISTLLKDGKGSDAVAKLPVFYQAVDKAAKRNVMHKNTASRRKAVMAKRVQATTAEANNSQAK